MTETPPTNTSTDSRRPGATSKSADVKSNLSVSASDWWTAARNNPLFSNGLLGALVVMLLDQATKLWVVKVLRLPVRRQIELSPIFDLTYVENRGASFGMLAGGMGSRILLSAISIVIVGFLVAWLARVVRPLVATGIALIIGGAIGNLIDRVLYGYVIDFLDFSGMWFPWVFNVADSAINIGVACLLADAVFHRDEAGTAGSRQKPARSSVGDGPTT